ncbi:MAG: hypothetical protein PUG15_07750 [Bacteroidales bacterium]|nr:hypothetical protein [Bacteroidales bacterium]
MPRRLNPERVTYNHRKRFSSFVFLRSKTLWNPYYAAHSGLWCLSD